MSHGYLASSSEDRHHAAIMRSLLARAGIRAGDRVLEIGAGSGRYTALLADQGLSVLATEPDAFFFDCLRVRFAGYDRVQVACLGVEQIGGDLLDGYHGIVGFHVLHHLEGAVLEHLNRLLGNTETPRGAPLAAAFLEPNPLNPLYALQIALHPGMRFREERGLWAPYCGAHSPCPSLAAAGHLGVLPPAISRRIAGIPIPVLESPTWSPWSCYRAVVRARSEPG
jgi:SAM-dependent methyltransferase